LHKAFVSLAALAWMGHEGDRGKRPRLARRWFPILCATASIIFVAWMTMAMGQPVVSGRASVIDGDTIEIAGQRVRFHGIDAPESWQTCLDGAGNEYRCGQRAALALADFLAASSPTHCAVLDRDRYGRLVGDCRRQDGISVANWLVQQGHALDWSRYSGGAFAADQAEAQRHHRGMWDGSFVEPWNARRK
jgi:endonuclease YncB( thermonuclease family)